MGLLRFCPKQWFYISLRREGIWIFYVCSSRSYVVANWCQWNRIKIWLFVEAVDFDERKLFLRWHRWSKWSRIFDTFFFWCAGIDKYFNKDQLQSLHKSTMQGTAWQDETLVKALKLRLSCGSQGYSVVRELASPLPTERTIQRRIEGFKFTPGILTEMFDILKIKVCLVCYILSECHLCTLRLSPATWFGSATVALL